MPDPFAEMVFEAVTESVKDAAEGAGTTAWAEAMAVRLAATGLPEGSAETTADGFRLTTEPMPGRVDVEAVWTAAPLEGPACSAALRGWLAAVRRAMTVPPSPGGLTAFVLAMPVEDRQFKSWARGPAYDALLDGLKKLPMGGGRAVLADPSHPLAPALADPALELTAGQAGAVLTNLLARTLDGHPHFRRVDVSHLKSAGRSADDTVRVWMWTGLGPSPAGERGTAGGGIRGDI
jgi:hypothetical protein